MMRIGIDAAVEDHFPGLEIRLKSLIGVGVAWSNPLLEEFKKQVLRAVSEQYSLEDLKDVHHFRIYRDFFWKIGIDPTKTRPAAEALIRRVLAGKPIPKINTLVDAYNLASIKTGIPLAAFDRDMIVNGLRARFAELGEQFFGIAMEKPLRLRGGEIVVVDDEKLVALYPHRDSDETKIRESTRNVLLMTCGAPGIGGDLLAQAERIAVEYVLKFCGGDLEPDRQDFTDAPDR
jgi:DNA/RNA-binding domain of Phe-tRNA-synthetase-like protein